MLQIPKHTSIMSPNVTREEVLQPTTLQEAINIIKFLNITHKDEMKRLKESHAKQAAIIKKLEANRKKELEFLSSELHKYETNLADRTESINKQMAEKDEIILKQMETIEELNRKLMVKNDLIVPEIIIDSNSDSGVVLDSEDISVIKTEDIKVEVKTTRKCSRRFADSIGFLRRVDFSPMKYKPGNKDGGKKKEEKKSTLEVPPVNTNKRLFTRQFSNDRPSDDERIGYDDSLFSEADIEPIIVKPKIMNDSMNNYISDDESDDTSEEMFDRVMARSSVRKSVKVNPKYKKINRCKSKLLDQLRVHVAD